MAYDPTLPADNSLASAAELRNQLAGLKALIDAQATQISTLQTQINAILSAPSNIVLSYDGGPDEASWTYDGDAPAQWELSYSQDSGATWQVGAIVPGSANNGAPDVEPGLMRVRALDAANLPISDFSNTVNVG